MPATNSFSQPHREWPGFWFARLEEAVAEGDFHRAAEASAELRRLGVEVRYVRPLTCRPAVGWGEVASAN